MKTTRILLLLPLFLMAATAAFGQQAKFSVVSFEEQPLDMSAREKPGARDDGTGSLYAIIKVTSTNPSDDLREYIFDFDYLKHVVEVKDGELWVYVQRNAKHVTISRSGYRTVRNYDLRTTIRPGKVYAMQLSSEAKPVYRQMVQFNVKPAGVKATVTIKSSKAGAQLQRFGETDENGSVARSLELGTYTYIVMADNYHNSEGRIVLEERNGNHVEEVVLRSNFSNITLTAAPGAEIYIDGEKKGTGSWSGALVAGNYNVECRLPNHKSAVQVITVEESNNREIKLRAPVPITGVLAVTSQPLGARIHIDGKDYGVTPKNIDNLLIGNHKVEISKANYKSAVTTVEIRENETTEYNAKLNDIARMTIKSRPQGASLYINGKYVGQTPHSAEMASGDYNIRLVKENYKTFEKRVHLDSSKPVVTYSLNRMYQKKYSVYAQAGYRLGSLPGFGAAIGGYLHNFNVEAYGIIGTSKETVYINYTNGMQPGEENLSAKAAGCKFGYGFVLGTRFRLTPQVGVGMVTMKSDEIDTGVVTASLGLRCECTLLNNFGVSLTPEYSFAVSEKDVFKELSAVSSACKGWGSGLNACVGLYICF